MSYKPDETVLMAYLYGELDAKEKESVEIYFESHPEELKKLQEMADVLKIMGAVEDKEVIAPPVFMDNETPVVSFWRSTYMKTITSIAASILLLIVAGKLIGPEIRYGSGELTISFGKASKKDPSTEKQVAALTTENVQQMINASMAKTTAEIDEHLNAGQEKLKIAIRQSLDKNSRKVDDLIRNTSSSSKEQMQAYVSGLQTENLRLMKDYFQLSSKEQKDYVENLLVGFSNYIQEQRDQDLFVVQTKVNSLEKNSDQFKQETEQLLTSIISNTSGKKNSY